MNKKKQYLAMLASIGSCVLFGLTFIYIKRILNTGISPYIMLSWRLGMAMAAMLLLAAVGVFKLNLKGKRLWRLLPPALCEPCFYFIFESAGVDRTSASESGIIMAMVPIVVLIMSRLLFAERANKPQVIGVVLSVVGVIVIVLAKGADATFSISGYLLLLMAVIMAAGYIVMARWASDEFSGTEIAIGNNVIGFVFFTVLAIINSIFGGGTSEMWLMPLRQREVLFSLLYLSIASSILAFLLMNYAIRVIGASRYSIFMGFNTLTSIVAGIIMLGETLVFGQGVGALLIIVGVTAANYFGIQQEEISLPSGGV